MDAFTMDAFPTFMYLVCQQIIPNKEIRCFWDGIAKSIRSSHYGEDEKWRHQDASQPDRNHCAKGTR